MSKIITTPNPLLNKPSKPVLKIDDKIKDLAEKMIKTIKGGKQRIGVGLSAVQVGKPLQLFVAYSARAKKEIVFINPKITWYSKEMIYGVSERENPFEGCLSVLGIWAKIKRHQQIKITYQTLSGRKKTQTFSGFFAVIVQHEYDHLQGILFTQRALEQREKLYKAEKDEEGKIVFSPIGI